MKKLFILGAILLWIIPILAIIIGSIAYLSYVFTDNTFFFLVETSDRLSILILGGFILIIPAVATTALVFIDEY